MLGNILTSYDSTTDSTASYAYDALGRLISEIKGGTSRYYTYDEAGNRTKAIVDTANTIVYTYDSDGRLISETLNNGQTSTTTSYTYDANGNLTSKTANNVTTTYTFDVWGNMTSAAGATYTYNVQGLRIAKTIGNKAYHFQLVNGRILSINTYEYYLLGYEIVGNGSVYYLYNAHGDVIQLLNSNGEVTKTYDYDAYGNELTRDLNDSNPFRYRGEYYDTETGFIYLRARYYSPSTGRFISQDTHWNVKNMIYGDKAVNENPKSDISYIPQGNNVDKDNSCKENPRPDISAILQSTNLYAYCMNNPVNYVDYTGNFALELAELFYAVVCAFLVLCTTAVTINTTNTLIESIPQSIPGIKGGHVFPHDFTISEPKVEAKNETDVITDSIPIPKSKSNIHIFPFDPFKFWPIGLVLKIYVPIGNGRNGGIFKWELPGTTIAIFEWNEDYNYGPHYHAFLPSDNNKHTKNIIHYYPGSIIPEPWNTLYFGGK